MKKIVLVLLCALLAASFVSCKKSNKTIIRMQHFEEGVGSPNTIEELKDAINKYEERVADIQLANSQIGIWYKILATRYLDKEMYGEAMGALEKALEYYPNNQNLYYYVGTCAVQMVKAKMDFDADGRNEKREHLYNLAEEAFNTALEIDPRYVRALYSLGVLYTFELNEPEKAIPHLELIMEIEKKNFTAMFVLARAYYMTYEYDKAIEMYDKVISLTKAKDIIAEAEKNKNIVMDAAANANR